jgi:geranylgeranyl diphosphate synthase type II
LRCGAIIAGASDKDLENITELAQKLGVAFQISDDILDVISTFEEMGKTIGKDENADKLTYVTLYGLEKSKCKLSCILDECCDMINSFDTKSEVLLEIISGIKKRVGI